MCRRPTIAGLWRHASADLLATAVYLVDQTVVDRFLTAHEAITVGVTGDHFDRLAGVVGQHLVQALANEEDFLGVDFDVRRLTLETTQRLPWKPPSGW